jgi:phospholipid/cholesterol/gamma-HCH transport system substrate-binding protein
VVDELNTAFAGSGPQLQALIDSSSTLTNDAMNHLPQTTQLLRDATTVLNTQNQQASNITQFSRDLRSIAAQLKTSDADLRRVITTAPQLSEQVIGLLRETGPNLGVVVANLLTTTNIAVARKAGIEQLLVTFPLSVSAALTTVVPGDGTAHFGLALNVFDPPPCTKGYEGTQRRPGTDSGAAPVNNQAYCAEAPGNTIDVRGAQNNPNANKPVSPAKPAGVGKSPANLAQLLGLTG